MLYFEEFKALLISSRDIPKSLIIFSFPFSRITSISFTISRHNLAIFSETSIQFLRASNVFSFNNFSKVKLSSLASSSDFSINSSILLISYSIPFERIITSLTKKYQELN